MQIQISAYLDNVFDVAALMEDSETKTAALERVAELEDELALVSFFSHACFHTLTVEGWNSATTFLGLLKKELKGSYIAMELGNSFVFRSH